MLPITGPFSKAVNVKNAYYRSQSGYKQAKPFDLVLPFTSASSGVVVTGQLIPGGLAAQQDPLKFDGNNIPYQTAYNRCYGKFADAMRGPQSELLTLLLEFEQTWDMIYRRARDVIDIFRYTASGNIPRLFDTMSRAVAPTVDTARRRKRAEKYARSKDVAGGILEVNYGWVPLIQDITGAFEAVCQKTPSVKIKVSASVSGTDRELNQTVIDGSPDLFHSVRKYRSDFTYTVFMGATARVTNPNLYLLNALGLLNPALSLYQVTWMSHVVNWFTDLETVMSAWTDQLGVELQQPYTSTLTRGRWSDRDYFKYNWVVQRNYSVSGWGVRFTRAEGIAPPRIDPRWGIRSWPRAMNAVSQLVQMLPR
jgi:hypothetical protein